MKNVSVIKGLLPVPNKNPGTLPGLLKVSRKEPLLNNYTSVTTAVRFVIVTQHNR